MKEEGTLHGEKIEGSKYANFLASRNDSRNDSYAAMKEEGIKNGRVVLNSSYHRFLEKKLVDTNDKLRRKLEEEEKASWREYNNLTEV